MSSDYPAKYRRPVSAILLTRTAVAIVAVLAVCSAPAAAKPIGIAASDPIPPATLAGALFENIAPFGIPAAPASLSLAYSSADGLIESVCLSFILPGDPASRRGECGASWTESGPDRAPAVSERIGWLASPGWLLGLGVLLLARSCCRGASRDAARAAHRDAVPERRFDCTDRHRHPGGA